MPMLCDWISSSIRGVPGGPGCVDVKRVEGVDCAGLPAINRPPTIRTGSGEIYSHSDVCRQASQFSGFGFVHFEGLQRVITSSLLWKTVGD